MEDGVQEAEEDEVQEAEEEDTVYKVEECEEQQPDQFEVRRNDLIKSLQQEKEWNGCSSSNSIIAKTRWILPSGIVFFITRYIPCVVMKKC